MKIRNMAGRVFTPGVIADIPTGNLLWVDQVHGNDDMAARERMTVPFKTLVKAKDLAVSGDTIVVMPGIYDETNLAKAGVNWHFLTGAVVSSSATAGALFDTTGLGGAVFKVTGHGQFETTNTTTPKGCLFSAHSSDDVHLEVARITSELNSTNGQAVYIDQGSEGLYLYGCKLIVNTAASGLKAIDADASTIVIAMAPLFSNADKGANVSLVVNSTFVSDSHVQ